jgi:5-methylcytosine-specific restriction endonuclease McrA
MPTRPPRAQRPRVLGQPAAPQRVSARQRGYTTKWDEARKGFLAKHTRCECPQHRGMPTAPRSDTLDHIIPHKGDKTLFWDRSNWQAMSASCHSTKTGRYDRPDSVRKSIHTNDLRSEPVSVHSSGRSE